MTDGNQLAYPCDGNYAGEARSNNDAGLTKREYFAAMAMEGYLASYAGLKENPVSEIVAGLSVKCADALIAELNKPS